MSHVAHELTDEFPAKIEEIHQLKASNGHFARIAERYHDLNRTLHRMETNVEPADDATMEELKKERLKLKDEIASILGA
ncbi:MAG: YdcH family protein [Rhodoblastus sp.]